MSLLGFQQALSELVMSPEFCSTVKTDPESMLTAFELTPLEHQRLVTLATQPGLGIGTMIHRSFRLSMLVNTLPKTCTVLEFQNLKQIVHSYWAIQPPRSFYYEQEASRFSKFILAQLEQGKIQNEFLEEVLRFELAVLSLTKAMPEQAPADTRSGYSDIETDFPCLNPLYRIVFFRHEPEILLTSLEKGQIPEDVTQSSYYLLLARSLKNQLQIKQVGSRLGKLLSACNGQSDVAFLCTQLSLTARDLEVLAESGYVCFKSSRDHIP